MRLVDGVDEHALFDMLERLTARTSAFAMPMMEVSTLRDFVAVLPTRPIAADHPLRRLADACVTQTDGLRLAGSEAELRRRTRSQALDAQEISLLQRWGYPYVFDCWKFHMTLSDSMHDQTVLERLLAEARRHFAAALADQLMCTSVSVFTESVAGAPFMLTRRFAFRR